MNKSLKSLQAFGFTLYCLLPGLLLAQDFDSVQITTVPVRDNIYMLQGSGGNIGVSVGNDGALIVDDQFAPLTEKIQNAIGELTPNPVEYVVNTHFHYDHSDGNENFGSAGATIVAQDNARKRMETTQVISLSGRVQEPYSPEGLPAVTFYDFMRLYYNDGTIDLVNTGDGHTDGDVQVFFRESNVIHTGDMFVRYGLPFIDQPNGGSTDGMIDALWNIAGMIDEDTIIIPGHGQLATRQDLLDYRDMLVTIRGRLQTAISNGRSADDVVRNNLAQGYAEPGAGTERWLRAAYEEYAED